MREPSQNDMPADASTDAPAHQTGWSEGEDTAANIARPKWPGTKLTLLVLGAIYLWSAYPGFETLRPEVAARFAFIPSAFNDGQWWRLLTANWIHADLHHLFNNAFGFFVFGQLLEPVIGTRRYLLVLFTTGLAAMGASWLFLPAPTLGASGMDYGLMGCYIALLLLIRRQQSAALFRQDLKSTLIFVVIFMVWGATELRHINVYGHVGGFLAGILWGLWFWLRRPGRRIDQSA